MSDDIAGRAQALGQIAEGCLGLFVFMPVVCILDGFVVMKLWAWFIVPAFHVVALSLPIAVGLRILLGIIRGGTPAKGRSIRETTNDIFMRGVFVPLYALGLGWLVKSL